MWYTAFISFLTEGRPLRHDLCVATKYAATLLFINVGVGSGSSLTSMRGEKD